MLSPKNTQAGVCCFISKLATATTSKVIEMPVFSQLWLELDEIWCTNQEQNAEFKEHKSGKLAAIFLDGRHRHFGEH
jgi:hypothetical protein